MEALVTLSWRSWIQLAFIAPVLMLSVFIEAFIHSLIAYLVFNRGIDLIKKGRAVLKRALKMWIWTMLLRLNFSKGIVSFFLYQNWLDPSKEIKKQIRGKCSRHSPTHTNTHTHSPANPHTDSILMNSQSFTKQPCWCFVYSWFLDLWIFCQVLPTRPVCAHWRHHQVGLNATTQSFKTQLGLTEANM